MDESTKYDWTPLHELALVFLVFIHGTDDQIDPTEVEMVMSLLKRRSPAAADQDLQDIMDRAMLVYMSPRKADMLASSVSALQDHLSEDEQVTLLQDLAELASADGLIYPGEISFISDLAHRWGLERFLS